MPRMPKFQSSKPLSAKDLLENRYYEKYLSELSEERDNKVTLQNGTMNRLLSSIKNTLKSVIRR